MRQSIRSLGLILFLGLAACSGGEAPPVEALGPSSGGIDGPVSMPQLVSEEDGAVMLVWRRAGEEGSDLYLARRESSLTFSTPVRINDQPGTISDFDLDELRPSVAMGPGGKVAVAWGDSAGDVRVALGTRHGEDFEPSQKLNQNEGKAAQSFPSIAFDESGVLHAVWLDTRVSGSYEEEPADLYYARVSGDGIQEANLTDDDTPSVCGCCRPGISADKDGNVTAVFRNTSTDGYRDIFRTSGTLEAGFGPARRLGPPLWELTGCPMAGPVPVGGETLWNDASTGERRTLLAKEFDSVPTELLAGEGEARILYPPRPVGGTAETLMLVPATPNGHLLRRQETGEWEVLPDAVPKWVTSAVLVEGRLVMAGAKTGELFLEERPFSLN